MLGDMVLGPVVLLRSALTNLAAEPFEQEERLRGTVIRDELALDFANAFEALASLREADTLDGGTMADLRVLDDKLSVAPGDSLWSEGLYSRQWMEIRSLAAQIIERL